jgi:cytochrome c peroxidase
LQFWDGRAPSLEEQAKGPIENPIEMGNTHAAMIQTVGNVAGYKDEFKQVFGTEPITVDQIAQAIAAFERTVVTTDSPFDRFVRGDQSALTPLEKKGLEIFNGKGHCTACHWGGPFSDGRFHNLGVAPADPAKPDQGRYAVTKDSADVGAFKTPTVRDAALRAPYMHNGLEKTLDDLVRLYDRGGGSDDANLDPLMVPLGLSEGEIQALAAFMKRAMTSTNPEVANVKPVSKSELPR